jgi:hypothetical protein
MNARSAIQSLRDRYYLKADAPVGIVGSYGLECKAVEAGPTNRDIIVVANTDDIDLVKEVVVPSGADTSYFFANRKVYVDHCTNTPACVGTLRSAVLRQVNGREAWQVRIGLYGFKNNPLVEDIWTIAQDGGIGVSIGFIPLDWGKPTPEEVKTYSRNGESPQSVCRRWKWLELSIASQPMNVACQTVGTVSGKTDPRAEKRLALLDSLVTKGRIRRETAHLLGLPKPKRHVLVLG